MKTLNSGPGVDWPSGDGPASRFESGTPTTATRFETGSLLTSRTFRPQAGSASTPHSPASTHRNPASGSRVRLLAGFRATPGRRVPERARRSRRDGMRGALFPDPVRTERDVALPRPDLQIDASELGSSRGRRARARDLRQQAGGRSHASRGFVCPHRAHGASPSSSDARRSTQDWSDARSRGFHGSRAKDLILRSSSR